MRMVRPTSTSDVDLFSDVALIGPPAAGQAPGGKPAGDPRGPRTPGCGWCSPPNSAREESDMARIVVDVDRCEGHGLCEQTAPEVFRLDDEGDLHLIREEVAPGRRP